MGMCLCRILVQVAANTLLVAFELNNFGLPDGSGINDVYLQLFDRVVTDLESGKRRVPGMQV